jgi:hypothetical protein
LVEGTWAEPEAEPGGTAARSLERAGREGRKPLLGLRIERRIPNLAG